MILGKFGCNDAEITLDGIVISATIMKRMTQPPEIIRFLQTESEHVLIPNDMVSVIVDYYTDVFPYYFPLDHYLYTNFREYLNLQLGLGIIKKTWCVTI